MVLGAASRATARVRGPIKQFPYFWAQLDAPPGARPHRWSREDRIDDQLWQLLLGMLGIAGLRTYEKMKGVAR